MRAMQLYGAGDLRAADLPIPTPGPGTVLVEVNAVGVCGTDASEFDHGPVMTPLDAPNPITGHVGPIVLGHEFAGVVTDVGAGVDPDWVGRPVGACGTFVCGQCAQCRSGRDNLCPRYHVGGLHRDGAMAEYAVAQVSAIGALDERGLSTDLGALGQPMSIAVHAVRRGRVRDGERVVVIGVGGIGAFLVHALVAAGAQVIAVDMTPQRRDLARSLGAQAVLGPDQLGRELVWDAAGGPVDVVVESTGRPDPLAAAFEMVPAGGRLVAVGIQRAPVVTDFARLTVKELEVIGTNAMTQSADFPRALDLVAARADWSGVVENVRPVQEAGAVLSALARGQAGPIKALLDPRIDTARAVEAGSGP